MVTTFAGSGEEGYNPALTTGEAAKFSSPSGVAVDSSGNVYVADTHNRCIRKIVTSEEGVVTVSTFAGSGEEGFANGVGTAAKFRFPTSVAVDSDDNLYVADAFNNRIRKITSGGDVTTLAGTGDTTQFNTPFGVAVDSSGNVYVADTGNSRIQKIITSEEGVVTVSTLAGSRTAAEFRFPYAVAVDSSGNVYVADRDNHRIRKITSEEGVVTVSTLAGSRTAAEFRFPSGVTVDSFGDVYVADAGNNRIRKITLRGVISTFAGTGTAGHQEGANTAAQFNTPYGVAVDPSGNVYVADSGNNRIRKITSRGVVSTFAGTGTAGHREGASTAAPFDTPFDVAMDPSGTLYVADTDNHRIREITPGGVVTTLAGSGIQGFANGAGTAAQFDGPSGVAVDSSGNVYVADYGNDRIRRITPEGVVTTLAGSGIRGFANGAGTAAQFDGPSGVAVDSSDNLYVADYGNDRIRKIIISTKVVSTLAGSTWGYKEGTGTAALFRSPYDVAVDSSGNVYVADKDNHRIRKIIISTKMVSTLAGSTWGYKDATGAAARFRDPIGMTVDSSDNLYVADAGNNRIRRITPGGVVSTFADSTEGDDDATGTATQLKVPSGVAVDSSDNLYVADSNNHLIRKIEYK